MNLTISVINNTSTGPKTLFTTECTEEPLTGTAIYFMRASTKKSLGEEAFQREILVGPLNMETIDNLIWQTERTITKIFLPFLNSKFITEKVNKPMKSKIRKDLLPCLRSFGRCAELILIKIMKFTFTASYVLLKMF